MRIDEIFDHVDKLQWAGHLGTLNEELGNLRPEELDTDTLLAWLTTTLPSRSRLPYRKRLFDATEALIKSRGEWEHGIMDGLE
jgi:hypothetical protein